MNWRNFSKQSKSLVKLAYPILIAQLIQNLMGFSDTVMAGRVSSTDMAAVAVASSIWLPLILTVYGLIMALAAIVSQLSGSSQYQKIAKATYQTAWIAISLGVALIALYFLVAPLVFEQVQIELQLKVLMFDYLRYIVWGAPGFCLYLVLRNYCEGMSITRPTMVVSIIGLLINIPANYIFIYGKFGMPALGGAGCGIATAMVYWVMFISMLVYTIFAKKLKPTSLYQHFYWPDWSEIKGIFSLGLPIAFSLLFEVSLFAAVAILLTPFGAQVVASHQIAINFSGLVFMVPLSLAMAVTIKVGFAVGNNEYQQAKEFCLNSIVFGLFLAVFTAIFTLVFRYQIAEIYTQDSKVINMASGLMFLAVLYQFSDTIQVISAGALRGYKDTKSILYITFFSYWVVGMSVGLILGITDWVVPKAGPYGFWIGFISGLTTAAILLGWRLKVIQKRYQLNGAVVG
ncbi:MAG: MATE family efflux transporter [Gammaproteobacteria bacterium]|nr:MAG: MATE family efflux transporter [Gammaproteobacteria bacterium]